MAKSILQSKRLQIDKTNASMVAVVAVASFVTVFSLVAVKSLWSQRNYQANVTSKKEKARDQLKKNIDTVNTLNTAYQAFVGNSQNVIGGSSTGSDDKDGDNAKIVLDALPSQYDFPALASSITKLVEQAGLKSGALTGTDDEVAQSIKKSDSNPQPIPIPFTVSATGDYDGIKKLITAFELSIRPINIATLNISGNKNEIQLTVTGTTYYQPAKDLTARTEEVK